MCGEFIDYITNNLALKVLQKNSKNYVSVSEKETMIILYLDKVGSDKEVAVKTELLGPTEVNHAHVIEIRQSIYERFEQIGI